MKTDRTPRPLTAAAALALCVATAVAGPAVKTVYQEDFDGYGDFTASFNTGVSITEAPASLKALSLAQAPGDARKTPFPVKTPPSTDRYTFSFAFRFGRGDAPHAFRLKLAFGAPDKPEEVVLTVDEAGSRFGAAPAAAPAAGRKGFLNDGNWNPALIEAQGRRARLFLNRGGVFAEECAAPSPPAG